ncbi:MAG TPA: S-methyl-5-thioribose-1-phosphate isomerase [bacterium]
MGPGIKTISYSATRNEIIVLDQTRLPGRVSFVALRTPEDVFQAIRKLMVRGAPLIGVAAAYGVVLAAKKGNLREILHAADLIRSARPTAVNLSWAIERMKTAAMASLSPGKNRGSVSTMLLQEARNIENEDKTACRRIGRFGARLIKNGMKVMVYCNAGALATSGIGTALGVLYTARRQRKRFSVYACETRPLLQGARLTTWELNRAAIEAFCICDNMAAAFMPQIGCILVGADRVAANGDTANKIGTRGLAIIAKYHRVPIYVVAPVSSFDLHTACGCGIPIEQRPEEEITTINDARITAAGTHIRNPAFDITPASLITAFVSDRGIISPPFRKNIKQRLSRT